MTGDFPWVVQIVAASLVIPIVHKTVTRQLCLLECVLALSEAPTWDAMPHYSSLVTRYMEIRVDALYTIRGCPYTTVQNQKKWGCAICEVPNQQNNKFSRDSIVRRNYCLLFGLTVALLPSSLAQAKPASITDLSTAIYQLKRHNNKTSTLDADQINRQTAIIQKNIDQIGQTSDIINEALDLVASYETTVGPLFMNQTTRGGFTRKPAGGLELDRAMFAVQQGLIDYAWPLRDRPARKP